MFFKLFQNHYLPVHPCDKETKGGCDQICNKDGDDAVCACNEPDYKLAEDGKSCDKGSYTSWNTD